MKIARALLFLGIASASFAAEPRIFTTRTVTAAIPPDTINYEGAPTNSQATVHLRAYAAGDSVLLGGSEADVFFVVDNSTSMGGRNPGSGFVQPPPAISFTQGAYNAAVNFIDSFMVNGNNRVGGLLFDYYMPLIAPLTSPSQDPGLLGVKDSFDRMLGQPATWDSVGRGSRIYDGLDSAITYMQLHARTGVQRIIILVTDGDNFWTNKTLADEVNRLNAINATGTDIQVYCIDIGTCGDVLSQNMIDIAAAGKGTAAFTCSGTDMDSIFQGIGQQFSSIAAYPISSGAPMIVDVFGPNIHLVPSSVVFNTSPGFMVPPYTVNTTPTGLTRISFLLDTVLLGREMQVDYKITGAITAPTLAAQLMRTNNSQGDDPTYYSVVQYKKYDGTPTTQSVDKKSLWVKSGVGGLKLSMSSNALVAPSASGTIALPYTVTTPFHYPPAYPDTFWYALIQLLGTNVAVYSQAAQASWYFNPDIAWQALRFNNDLGSAKKVGVTVSYDNAGSYPLRVQMNYGGVTYRDSVMFSATNATTENITRVGVDDDTTKPPATLDTIFITGNYSELTNPAWSKLLFSRGITNLGNSWPVNATWSATGFSFFNLSSSITGTGTYKLLNFGSPLPAYNNTPRNDAGVIHVSYNSQTGQMVVIIRDTTDYDTAQSVVVVPDGTYRSTTDKNTLYAPPTTSTAGTNAGDTLKFSGLLFDVYPGNITGKFLGAGGFTYSTQRVSWFRNGSPVAGADSTVSVTSGVPGSRDTLVAVWGTFVDTVFISWDFGKQRFLRIESAPGVVGTANAAQLDSLVFSQTTASRTAYAVVRDEFGYCVSNADLELWLLDPASAAYLQAPPSDSLTSVYTINKFNSPGSEQRYNLIAQLPPQVVAGVSVAQLEDTVKVILAQYNVIGVRIVADSSNHFKDDFNTGVWNKQTYGQFATSYRRNSPIGGDTVKVVALNDVVTLKVQFRKSTDSLWYSLSFPVQWTLSNYAWQAQTALPSAPQVTLTPTSRGNVVQLTASYNTGTGTLTSVVNILVEAALIDTFITQLPPVPVVAGDTVPLTIQAIDVAGNPVTDPTRVPTQVCYTVSGPVVIHVGNIDTLVNGTFCVNSPFSNGTLQTSFTPYITDTIHVTVDVHYPNGNGSSTYTVNFDLPVIPGPPSSIMIVRKGDTTAVGVDTLSPIGTSTVREYEALVFDAYGNPITDPAVLSHLTWSMTGLPGGPQNLGSFSNTASYNAYGLTAGGQGTLTATYNYNSVVVTDNAQLYVIPLVGVAYISTHEFVFDTTLSGLTKAEWILKEVGNLDPLTLVSGPSGSHNRQVLEGLRSLGYRTLRDGYLDYLDIQLTDSLTLRESFLRGISFSTIVKPNSPDAETLNVSWLLSDTVGARMVQARLELLDAGKTQYRLWLLPNAAFGGAHLETGFKPLMTFDNTAVRAANPSDPHPRLLGTGAALYTTSASLVKDSAAPVIQAFLLQNNACNPDNPLNKVKIAFSEPVTASRGDLTLTHSAFALLNGVSGDSGFVPNALTNVQGTVVAVDPFLAWELDPASDYIMTLEGTVRFEANGLFTPNTSRIRFALDATLTPVVDASGNVGTVIANREVTLENEQVFNVVCDLSGNTVIDRYDAMEYKWLQVEGETQLVPGFSYFGFKVNLSLADGGGGQTYKVQECPSQNLVVMDYDTAKAFVLTEVTIFDLFGNLVSTPASNKSLRQEFKISDVREYAGIKLLTCTESRSDIEKQYTWIDGVGGAPDTVRPNYPSLTFSVDYSYMYNRCGPASMEAMCVPAWNALNLKGRLVAPGGYIAVQKIITPGHIEEVVRKLIVTSREKGR